MSVCKEFRFWCMIASNKAWELSSTDVNSSQFIKEATIIQEWVSLWKNGMHSIHLQEWAWLFLPVTLINSMLWQILDTTFNDNISGKALS